MMKMNPILYNLCFTSSMSLFLLSHKSEMLMAVEACAFLAMSAQQPK
jgi:hypothetical protein